MSNIILDRQVEEQEVKIFANKCGVFIKIGGTLYAPFGKLSAEKIKEINAEEVVPRFRIVVFNYTKDIVFLVEPQFKHSFDFSLDVRDTGHFVLKMGSPYSCDSTWMVMYRLMSKTAYLLLKYVFDNAYSIEKAKD